MLGRDIRCPNCDQTIAVRIEETTERKGLVPVVESSDEVEVEIVEASDSQDTVEVVEVVSEVGDGKKGALANESRSSSSRWAVPPDALTAASPKNVPAEDEPAEEVTFEKKELPKDDMDMTPMVDVTFLLLIFFMITASFSSEKVFEKPPPISDAPSSSAPIEPKEILDTVRVQIDEFNAYTIILPTGDEREASSKQDLLIALGDAKLEMTTGKDEEGMKMLVEAHEECIHSAVVAALDAGREKGFTSFTVSVVEEFE